MFYDGLLEYEKKLKQLKDMQDSETTIDVKSELIKEIKNSIGLISFTGQTDSYWKDLEEANTKVMIISIPYGTFITNAKKGEEYSADMVNGKFIILDGLLYKSNDDSNPIVYMKV